MVTDSYKRYRKLIELFIDPKPWSLSFDLSRSGLSFRIAGLNLCIWCLRIDPNDPENILIRKRRISI